ncbi:hypothetical protein E3N88_19857 [Mikania micrantha]|uniref:Peptidase S8/S53 domain-containing protein n=1 Tax=Mikania micrantha TaxID=192012 RepID=A0A5N6NPM4_9ASTR|nr:hypothetical protein E3N88_19857 [Mikania micrantha]
MGHAINAFSSNDEALSLVYGKEVTSRCSETDAREPKVRILKSEAIHNPDAPIVASFSARGPSGFISDIIKPDVTAPGVEILAAFSPTGRPSGNIWDKRSFNILSGTSMACPHVASVAAFVKSFHPDWSPSAIKYALMTTEYMRIWCNISQTLGSAIPINASCPVSFTRHRDINYPSMAAQLDSPESYSGYTSHGEPPPTPPQIAFVTLIIMFRCHKITTI